MKSTTTNFFFETLETRKLLSSTYPTTEWPSAQHNDQVIEIQPAFATPVHQPVEATVVTPD